MFRIVPYSTRTGVPIRALVEVSDWSFTESITQPGRGVFSLPLRSLGMSAAMNRRLVSGWETTWTVESNPAPAFRARWDVEYAGLVTDWDWDAETGVATVTTFEIEKILELRPLWGTHGSIEAVFNLSGQNIGDIIREVLWYSIASNRGDDRWPLPVDVGSLRHGPIERPEWRYHFRTAAAVLDSLASEDAAPDWVLRPYKEGDLLRWRLELGTPYLGGDPIRLPVAAPGSEVQSQVVGLTVRHDYQDELTGINVMGAGSEVDMRWGTAGTGQVPEARAQIPALIGIGAHKTIDDRAQLDSLARSELRSAAGGVQQWSWSVQTGWGERVTPAMIRAGSMIVMDHPGDELTTRGRYAHYVLSRTLSPSGMLNVESQGVS